MTRATTVLSRFPVHLGADREGTVLADVVDALVQALDVQTSQLGRVRAAHRLAGLDEEADLRLLAGLHGLGPEVFEVVRARLSRAAELADVLSDPATTAEDADAAAATLHAVLGLPVASFGDPAQLAAALVRLLTYARILEALRTVVREVVRSHRGGNATVGALLSASAAYLGLELQDVTHLEDRFWHVARCTDRLRLVGGDGADVAPVDDLLALEENPFRPQTVTPVPRRPGEIFQQLRGGFEQVQVSVRVVGIEDRTVGPTVVAVAAGRGVVWTGTVPDGQELRFERDGRITLAGENVTRRGFSFLGAVFAGPEARPGDFVFAADSADAADGADGAAGAAAGPKDATFVVTAPLVDALDPSAAFPHSGGLVDALPMPVGESTWVLFVGEGAFGGSVTGLAVPSDRSAFTADATNLAGPRGSVFADGDGAPLPPAAAVGFDWQEREPYAVRVWLPQRFAGLSAPGRPPVHDLLRALLARHRAGGVHVYVEHADDRWTLGAGVVRDPGSTAPVGGLVLGTRLWEAGATDPSVGPTGPTPAGPTPADPTPVP